MSPITRAGRALLCVAAWLTLIAAAASCSAADTEEGYESLFNGRDLAGWERANPDAPDSWSVADGAIVCSGERGTWLRSGKQYGDFNLRLEYAIEPGGNSGIYLRVPHGGAHRGRELADGGPSGVEIQLLDDVHEKFADLAPYQYCGSIYSVAPSTKRVGRAAGEWNTLEINCRGQHYTVKHNGEVIVDVTADSAPKLADRELRGYVGLQNHGSKVRFRNLRIGPAQK